MLRPHTSDENSGLLLQFIFKELLSLFRTTEEETNPTLLAQSLTGKSARDMRIFSWSVQGGPLTQLRYYASLLSQKKLSKTPAWKHFQKSLSSLWLSTLSALESDRQEFKFQDQVRKETKDLTLAALELAESFKTDENVLFYLARHEPGIRPILGEGAIRSFFHQLFSSVEKGLEFVTLKYKERAFLELLPQIETSFRRL